MSTTLLKVGDHQYQIGKLNVFEQLMVAKRLAPLFASLMATGEIARSGDQTKVGDLLIAMLPKLSEGLATLKDEDLLFVVKKCLSAVRRQAGPGFVPVVSDANQRLMLEDIDLPQMLELTWAVINQSLSSFFPSPAPTSAEQAG